MTRNAIWLMALTTALFFSGVVMGEEPSPYMVIDLSGGVQASEYPVGELAEAPKGGWSWEYKTSKLVLRYIPPGSFIMGSPKDEFGRPKYRGDENQHKVTLTKGFYIGVFEVTQSQWSRVMGDWPSYFRDPNVRDSRPVEMVSYDLIRKDGSWPTTNTVHKSFFMGRIRTKTGMVLDLPTDAQWEYACRAGTTNALNSGKELTGVEGCMNLAMLGRFLYNAKEDFDRDSGPASGTAQVGSYAPNAWGLYDMHGNVLEWVLDWDTDGHRALGSMGTPQVDPKGTSHAPPGHPGRDGRVARGGSWSTSASYTRSASRFSRKPSIRSSQIGFRLAMPVGK